MFGKFKDDNDQPSIAIQQSQSPAPAEAAERVSADQISSISRSMTVVGKIVTRERYMYSARSRANFMR